MTFLLVAVGWILVLALVAGLCLAARLGEVARQPADATGPTGWESPQAPVVRQAESFEISARGPAYAPRVAAESEAPFVRRGRVAA